MTDSSATNVGSDGCWNPNCFYREELAWAADKLLRASAERDALLRWLDEQIESEKEWGGIAGNACADAYEHVKAHIEGRDTDE